MKKTFVVVFIIALFSFIVSSFHSEKREDKMEYKMEKKIKADFQENCQRIEDTLKAQDLEMLEDKLPRSRNIALKMQELREIKKASLELVEEAKKIGSTDEGNYKLGKATDGSFLLIKKIFEITRTSPDESGNNPNEFIRRSLEEKNITKEI